MDLKFRCKLLSDVILNQQAATEGNQSTLDFIPGNNFLGIVAGKIYAECRDLAMEILHSGKVRFGDAHPALNGIRSLRVPASFFYPKLGSYKKECYVHHGVSDLSNDELRKKQLKQCRNGFLTFDDVNEKFSEVLPLKTFAIKSAYDRKNRRSKDAQMFGYESLCKGLELLFEVQIDDSVNSKVAGIISEALVGIKRVGRSKTAQYGLVEIKETEYAEPVIENNSDGQTVIYADSRLIFFDEFGLPTFTPTAEQLGCPGGRIVWELSQVRSFQYSPWNFKRQSRDMDRCGIEKGSVFVVRGSSVVVPSQYVGEFKNEGFGRVIYNPKFLTYDIQGIAKYSYNEICLSNVQKVDAAVAPKDDSILLKYLRREQGKIAKQSRIYTLVNNFISEKAPYWLSEDSFASQWGTIRSIAMRFTSRRDIMDELFDAQEAYLEHGVAAQKWNENSRKECLKRFLDSATEENKLSDAEFKSLVVNLASEMAKKIQGGV